MKRPPGPARSSIVLVVAAWFAVACTRPGSIPAALPTDQSEPSTSSGEVGTSVGQLAPAFAVTGLDGRMVTDADLHATQKPYILFFYATW